VNRVILVLMILLLLGVFSGTARAEDQTLRLFFVIRKTDLQAATQADKIAFKNKMRSLFNDDTLTFGDLREYEYAPTPSIIVLVKGVLIRKPDGTWIPRFPKRPTKAQIDTWIENNAPSLAGKLKIRAKSTFDPVRSEFQLQNIET